MEEKDYLKKSLEGLGKFCQNWCMDKKETKEKNDLVFRCKCCDFRNEDKTCQIKTFLNNHAGEDAGKYTAMSR